MDEDHQTALTQDGHEVEERLVWMLMGNKPVDYMFNFEGKKKETVCFNPQITIAHNHIWPKLEVTKMIASG